MGGSAISRTSGVSRDQSHRVTRRAGTEGIGTAWEQHRNRRNRGKAKERGTEGIGTAQEPMETEKDELRGREQEHIGGRRASRDENTRKVAANDCAGSGERPLAS